MDIENAMADSGKTYGGHKLFKTSVPGLYYTLFIAKLWSAYSTKTTISDSGLYIGDTTPQKFQWIITDPDLQHIGCDNAMRYDRFWAIGGVVHDLTIEFYTDTDFNLQQTRTYHCPVIRHIFMRLRPTVPVLVLLITAITFISTLIYSMLN